MNAKYEVDTIGTNLEVTTYFESFNIGISSNADESPSLTVINLTKEEAKKLAYFILYHSE